MQATGIWLAIIAAVVAGFTVSRLPHGAPSALLAQSGKRAIVLELTVPTSSGDPAKPRLTIIEGKTATAEFEDIGKIGFVPSFEGDQTSTVSITIFDASQTPMQRIEELKLTVKGPPVPLKTKPSITIAVLSVKQPK